MEKKVTLNYKIILNVFGRLIFLEGFLMLLGLPFSLYYGDSDFKAIILAASINLGFGSVLLFFTRNFSKEIRHKDGYFIVTVGWIIIAVFGTLPYLFSGAIDNFTDAFFETMSGLTTTGSSILNDIESVPKGILFWRSMTHWIGGMGIIVLTIAIIPFLGIGGMQLFVAEVPGPTPDKLHPRITETAKRLWGIYTLFTLLQTILLVLGGMNLFDSINHSFATMATGGFSTKNDSIVGFSPYIQYIITIFMIIAGTNFTLSYFAVNGKLRRVWKDEEFKFYIKLIFIYSIIIAAFLFFFDSNFNLESSFRTSIFQVVSIITTTGFVSSNYINWQPSFLYFFIFVLMFLGGSAGSTGGGMKIIRPLLLVKNSFVELKRLVKPNAVIPVRYNGKAVQPEIISKVLAFFFIYMIIFALSSLIMAMLGMDFKTAIGAVASSLGNIGPAIGKVGPVDNFSFINIAGKWFLSFLMLLGRLELFTVLILLTPGFWKK